MKAGSNNTGIGQPVQRRKDFRLLTGKGCYSDDFSFPGQAYAVMVRSPHARVCEDSFHRYCGGDHGV
jgi:CO/xanthine dehydrogenase Mo-binding subunit